MKLNNMEVRQAIEKKRLKYYEVAEALNIHNATLSRWLQTEMNPKKKQAVLKAINDIKI